MTTATHTFDDVDKALLEEIQVQFPVDHRPFQILGQKLDISEQECVERIDRLKSGQVIRQISASFDARALGYQTALAAMKIGSERVDEAARLINQHPGVSHSYTLNDAFNLWFTVAIPPADSPEQMVPIFHALAKAEETIVLPTLRLYKTGGQHERADEESWLGHQEEADEVPRVGMPKPALTEQDIRLIRIVQEDLPLLEIPFAVWAEQAECTEEELFAWVKRAQHLGGLRRFAATLAPRETGLLANAMVVWQVPPEQVDAIGKGMALFREVSGCYRRPVYPHWPYALFTALRAATYSACMEAAKRIEDRVGQFPHKHLFFTKEHQRLRVKYFSSALETWWREVGSRVDI